MAVPVPHRDCPDPLVKHWLEQASAISRAASLNSQSASCRSKAKMSTLATPSMSGPKYSWLWEGQAGALSDTLLRILQLPSAKGGASAEEIAAKQLNPTLKDEYRLHSVVLAANSAYFRHRLLGPSCNAPSGSEDPTNSHRGQCDDTDEYDAYEGYESSCGPASGSTHGTGGQKGCSVDSSQPLQPQAQEPGAGASAGAGTRSVYVLEERLHPSDMPAAKAVLCHMYTEELQYESPSQLVTILKIADKWKARDTIDACRTAFSRLQPDDLDLEVIKQVYCLEGIIHDVQNFAELVAAVQSRLVRMFQDVVEVVQNPSMRTSFLQLPFAAVLALLRSPELVVDTENSVVVAANLWLSQGKGRSTTQEQRRFLASVVHLPGLTPSYLCGVMPNLRWFTPPGQPFTSWAQTLPGPYFAELQERLVGPKSKALVQGGGRAPSTSSTTSTKSATSALALSPTDNSPPLQASVPSTAPASAAAPAPATPAAAAGQAGAAAAATARAAVDSVFGAGWSVPGQPRAPEAARAAAQTAPASRASSTAGSKRSSGSGTSTAAPTAEPPAAATALAPSPSSSRILRDQNLEIECDIDSSRLRQYIADGYAGLQAGQGGFKGIHVHSECSYFRGFMWGVKLVFGFSTGHSADGKPPTFTVTPSPFAALPPGEEGMRPLVAPITVTFHCTMEALGPSGSPYACATYQGATYIKPNEEHLSSVGIANFFKRVPQQHIADSWAPFLVDDKLKLRLRVMGASVE